jgi:hypothetical protein
LGEEALQEGVAAQLVQALRSACAGLTPSAMLEELYWPPSEPVPDGVATVLNLVEGLDQIACIQLVDSVRMAPMEAVMLLNALLRQVTGATHWAHFALSHHLGILLRMGVVEARMPLAVHSFLAAEGFPTNEYVQSGPRAALATSLAAIAPREAVAQGLLATRMGIGDALAGVGPAFNALGLPRAAAGLDLLAAGQIAAAIGSPQLAVEASYADDCDGASRLPGRPAGEVVHSPPQGAASHYVFRGAEAPLKVPALDVFAIDEATYSVDLSKLGRPEYYVASLTSWVADLCLGGRPFIESPPIEVEEPVLALEDRFSTKLNNSQFLFDHLPRALLYRERGAPPEARVLVPGGNAFIVDALAAAGFDHALVPPGRRFTLHTPRLYVASNMFRDWDHPASLGSAPSLRSVRGAFGMADILPGRRRPRLGDARAFQVLRRAFRAQDSSPARRRLLLSGEGRVTNWPEMVAALAPRGFEPVDVAEMGFAEQRTLFGQAECIVGVHGTALTGLLFAPGNAHIVEILPPLSASTTYWMVASGIGMDYRAIIADDPDLPPPDYRTWQHNPGYDERPVVVPIDRLRTLIAEIKL